MGARGEAGGVPLELLDKVPHILAPFGEQHSDVALVLTCLHRNGSSRRQKAGTVFRQQSHTFVLSDGCSH